MKVKWEKAPAKHDYPAAMAYLSLIYNAKTVSSIARRLRGTRVTSHEAKDILRASGLSPLGMSNRYVKKSAKKIRADESISPIILVRDPANGGVIIADGYHRLCALYSLDECAVVKAKIV